MKTTIKTIKLAGCFSMALSVFYFLKASGEPISTNGFSISTNSAASLIQPADIKPIPASASTNNLAGAKQKVVTSISK